MKSVGTIAPPVEAARMLCFNLIQAVCRTQKKRAPARPEKFTVSLTRPNREQILAVFDGLPVAGQLFYDLSRYV
jgi:hypothetical protein